MAAVQGEEVYCTLVMSDSYLPGAAVLAHSLRDAGAKKKLAALITLDTLSADTITELKELYDYLLPVDRIRNPNPGNLYLMDRADLSFAFTKINLWRQTQFRKIVYLDADVVILRAPDELFSLDAQFAAAPDVGWPDAFNSGVMLLTPNMGDYWALQTMAATGDSFDGADQGLLNQYYENRNWHRLPFTYNTTPNAQYQWEPAYRYYKRNISAVHFIGKDKPWMTGRQSAPGSGVYNELLSRWWAVFDRHLREPKRPAPAVQKTAEHGSKEEVGTTALGHVVDVPTINEAQPTHITTDMPFTDPGEPAENIDQGLEQPIPTHEVRKFSAPNMEWDATRSAPPVESKPEAANFPTAQYEFSESRKLFAPPKYAEPPKDMWYEVPKTKPAVEERPKPIFPWEREREPQKASRVFAEDLLPSPPTQAPPRPGPIAIPGAFPGSIIPGLSSPRGGPERVRSPQAYEQPSSPPTTWENFNQQTNTWDAIPQITERIRAIMESQQKRDRPMTINTTISDSVSSPPPADGQDRRASLILTNFPSADERPSLPVTPAPIRRPTFWGEERDETGELPAAAGVPDQADWNPAAQLDQLRRGSLAEFEHLLSPDNQSKDVPLRDLPEHAAPLPGPMIMGEGVRSPRSPPGKSTSTSSHQVKTSTSSNSQHIVTSSTSSSSSTRQESQTTSTQTTDPRKGKAPVFVVPDFSAQPPSQTRGGIEREVSPVGPGFGGSEAEKSLVEKVAGGVHEKEEKGVESEVKRNMAKAERQEQVQSQQEREQSEVTTSLREERGEMERSTR